MRDIPAAHTMPEGSRVLFFCAAPRIRSDDQSGAGSHIRGVVEGLRSHGLEVELLLCGDGSSAPTRAAIAADEKKSRRQRLRDALPRSWAAVRSVATLRREYLHLLRLRSAIHANPPTLVYERLAEFQGHSTSITARAGVPHVVEVNSFPGAEADNELRALRWVRRRLAQHLLRRATFIVAVSSVLRDELQASFSGLPPIEVLPNAAPPIVPELVEPWKRPANIIFAGSMRRWHRLDLLIGAVQAVDSELDPKVTVIVAGDGPELAGLRRMAAEYGVLHRFEFTGQISKTDLQLRYRECSIGVLPGNPAYGSPTKLLEYAANRLAIIGPDTQGVRDLFTHDVNAILVPPSVAELASALLLLQNGSTRRRLSGASVELASQWTWGSVAASVLKQCLQLRPERTWDGDVNDS